MLTTPTVSCERTLVPQSELRRFCMTGSTGTFCAASTALAWFCQPTEGSVAVPDSPMTKRWVSKVTKPKSLSLMKGPPSEKPVL